MIKGKKEEIMKKRNKFFVVAGLAILCLGGLYGCKKSSKDTNGKVTDIPEELTKTPTPIAVISPETSITPEGTITPENTITPEGTITPQDPTPIVSLEPSPTPTPIPTPILTQEEAKQTVRTAISDKKYEIETGSDSLFAEGREYYVFAVSEKGRYLEPSILVDKEDGTLHFYDSDGKITDFTKFPLDNVEIVDDEKGKITQEEAIEKLKGFNIDTLRLNKPFDQYETEVDTWTTMVNGEECYGINVFDAKIEGRPLTGIYYVAVDGTAVYTVDEDNNFILLN